MFPYVLEDSSILRADVRVPVPDDFTDAVDAVADVEKVQQAPEIRCIAYSHLII